MISLASGLILLASITVGSFAFQHQTRLTEAVIYYESGAIEHVSVKNRGSYFCPRSCMVDHRHLVHDVRWLCDEGEYCSHFNVFHVINRGGKTEAPRLLAGENNTSEGGALAGLVEP